MTTTLTEGEILHAEHGVNLIRKGHYLNDASILSRWAPDLAAFNDEDHVFTGTGAGTPVQLDKLGNWVRLPTGSSDNNEIYMQSPGENFIFNTTDIVYIRARVTADPTTAGDGGLVVGFSDTIATDFIVDAGTGLATSFDGAAWVVTEDTTTAHEVDAVSSNASSQVIDTGVFTFTEGDDVTLEILYDPGDGTTAKVFFLKDGALKAVHALTISGLLEMHGVVGGKTFSGEVNNFDFTNIEAIQRVKKVATNP